MINLPQKIKLIIIVVALLLLSSCDIDESITPNDLIAPTAESQSVYQYYFPVIKTENTTLQGLAKAYGNITGEEADSLGIKWYYDYALRYPFPKLGNAVYVPFFWCDQYPALAYPAVYNYFDALAKLPDDYSGYLLFLNEPDLRGGDTDGWQCDRTPRQAAYIYKAVLRECPNCKIVGPASSHIDYLNGWPWLKEFYREIDQLGLRHPDIAAVHDYTGQTGDKVVNSLFRALDEFGGPDRAWVTEFADCDPNIVNKTLQFYKQDKRVERYAWFTGRGYPANPCINLLADDKTIVGEMYSPYP